MKKAIFTSVLALMLPSAAYSVPSYSGEGVLVPSAAGFAGFVDYEVFAPGDLGNPTVGGLAHGALWTYLYQIEVDSTPAPLDGVRSLTVNAGILTFVLPGTASFLTGVNLVHGDETNNALLLDPTSSATLAFVTAWDFPKPLLGGVVAGTSSSALYFYSTRGPRAGQADAIDGYSGAAPVLRPAPAPGAVLLIGLGLAIIGGIKRRLG